MPSQLQRQPISYVPDEAMFWKARYRTMTLAFLRVQDIFVPGWFSYEEGQALLELSEIIPRGTIVETGSFCGRSTRFLLLGAVLSNSNLYCVDIFTGDLPGEDESGGEWVSKDLLAGDPYPVFNVVMNTAFVHTDLKRLKTLRSEAIEQARKWGYGPIDLIFIDDDHTKCRQTVEAWLPHLSDHACIVFHDIHPGKVYGIDGPINTFNSMLQEGWKLIYGDGSTLLRAITRDPEWWAIRGEAVRDRYKSVRDLRSPESGLSERDYPYDPGPSATFGGTECDDHGNPVSSHDSNPSPS